MNITKYPCAHTHNICLHFFQEVLFVLVLLALQLDPQDREDPGGEEESAWPQDLAKVLHCVCMMLLRNQILTVYFVSQ